MADLIQFRRGTLARWNEVNPVLAEGELGLILDSTEYKIGDGEKAWNSLPMCNFSGDSAYQIAQKHGFVGSEEEWLDSLKAALTKEGIESLLTGNITSHTHPATSVKQDASHRFVSDTDKKNWNKLITDMGDVSTLLDDINGEIK